LETPQSTVSQHLARLRNAGIVDSQRDGVEKLYYLKNTRVEAVVSALFSGFPDDIDYNI